MVQKSHCNIIDLRVTLATSLYLSINYFFILLILMAYRHPINLPRPRGFTTSTNTRLRLRLSSSVAIARCHFTPSWRLIASLYNVGSFSESETNCSTRVYVAANALGGRLTLEMRALVSAVRARSLSIQTCY